MAGKSSQKLETDKLIHRLRLMAESGGMLSRDRIRTVSEAADRLEDLDERIAIMTEHEHDKNTVSFDVKGADTNG